MTKLLNTLERLSEMTEKWKTFRLPCDENFINQEYRSRRSYDRSEKLPVPSIKRIEIESNSVTTFSMHKIVECSMLMLIRNQLQQ